MDKTTCLKAWQQEIKIGDKTINYGVINTKLLENPQPNTIVESKDKTLQVIRGIDESLVEDVTDKTYYRGQNSEIQLGFNPRFMSCTPINQSAQKFGTVYTLQVQPKVKRYTFNDKLGRCEALREDEILLQRNTFVTKIKEKIYSVRPATDEEYDAYIYSLTSRPKHCPHRSDYKRTESDEDSDFDFLGGGRTKKHYVFYNNRKYLLRFHGRKQFIRIKKQPVYLSSIRGKYTKKLI